MSEKITKQLKTYNVKGNIDLGRDYCEAFWSEKIDIKVKAYSKENAFKKATKLFVKNKLKGTFVFNPMDNDYSDVVFEEEKENE